VTSRNSRIFSAVRLMDLPRVSSNGSCKSHMLGYKDKTRRCLTENAFSMTAAVPDVIS
jgi:hypothetical protein